MSWPPCFYTNSSIGEAAAEEVEAQKQGWGELWKELMLGWAGNGWGPRKGLGVAGLLLVATQSQSKSH